MKSTTTRLVVASVLAAMGFAASAQGVQTPPPPPAAPMAAPAPAGAASAPHRMFHRDPAQAKKKFEERMAKRQAELKTKLAITPAQEGAWSAFTASMKPPEQRPQRMDRTAMQNLTTPQRIDAMQKMRAERNAAMDRRADSVKTFYAALTPDQQKTFDVESFKHAGHHGRHGHGDRGGPRGPGGPGPRG